MMSQTASAQDLSQVDHLDLGVMRRTRLFMILAVPRKFQSLSRVSADIGQRIAQVPLGSKELDTACKWWSLKALLFLRRASTAPFGVRLVLARTACATSTSWTSRESSRTL